MKVTLLDCTQSKNYIFGSRTCYDSMKKSTPESDATLVNNLLQSGHHSVFEHGFASFFVEDISLNCSHQLVRQRLLSFSQRSGRYVALEEMTRDQIPDFFSIPHMIDMAPEREEYIDQIFSSVQLYQRLLSKGFKKEDARSVLPQAMFTRLVMSGNFREWLHVIDIRASKAAQWEIRNLAIAIWKILYREHPLVFGINYFVGESKDLEYKRDIFEKRIHREKKDLGD